MNAATPRALNATAFATLLLVALMMGANHVAARIAFNNGVDVATAVLFRSGITAIVIVVLLQLQGVRVSLTGRHRGFLLAIGLLIGLQSLRSRGCRWRWHCWRSTPFRYGPRCGPG